jgi:2,5-furandicarboxylate decarboxylase 1
MISDEFRLTTFLDVLDSHGELAVIDDPVELAAVAGHLERDRRAILFRNVGPKGESLVGNVMGSRSRLALALGTTPDGALPELRRRLAAEGAVAEVPSGAAPVHEVIETGADADLTEFPVHLQHEHDGAPYISAAYDVSRKATPGAFNCGCRRLMLRGPRTTGVGLVAPSDLRIRYLAAVEAGEDVPIAFVVGAHPLDYLGAAMRANVENELCLLSALRGAPLPVVRCVTQDLVVPADAEIVIEGYLDRAGYTDAEGPYGEYLGFYGVTSPNPVFHVTAITRRRDALFQTVTISGPHLARTDTAQLGSLSSEVKLWDVLSRAVKQPVAVYVNPASGGTTNNARVSIRAVSPGESKNAIHAILGACDVKTVQVTDDDVDIFSDEEMDWVLATRYRPDEDTVVLHGLRTSPLDPSLRDPRAGGAKLGLDLTRGVGQGGKRWSVPQPPQIEVDDTADGRALIEVLADGPATFAALMRATNTADGRALVRELGAELDRGAVRLDVDGTWQLADLTGEL